MWDRYRFAAAALAALWLLPLAGCVNMGRRSGEGAAPEKGTSQESAAESSSAPEQDARRSTGSTHAGMQTPSQDFAASAGNSMSGQMDNSIKGSLSESSVGSGASTDVAPSAGTGSPAGADAPAAAQAENVPQSASAQPQSASDTVLSSQPDGRETSGASSAAEPRTADPEKEGFLTLVNRSNRLPPDYAPPLGDITGSEKQLHTAAAAALNAMLADAAAAGCPLFVVSGYRSVKYQQGLFERRVQRCLAEGVPQAEAEAQAAQWVAPPGASEHSLGLAADLVSGDWYLSHDDLTREFEDTAAFAWLVENAARYGFILRYPAEKEAVTGVHYEPWHWRYVGDAAAAIAADDLCLEEWLARRGG